jgi:hypothetical protein
MAAARPAATVNDAIESEHASIWSLRRRVAGNTERLLTVELDCQFRAIQARGFGNRTPHAEERKILERWAKARGIELL